MATEYDKIDVTEKEENFWRNHSAIKEAGLLGSPPASQQFKFQDFPIPPQQASRDCIHVRTILPI